jgi:hypothetical protein
VVVWHTLTYQLTLFEIYRQTGKPHSEKIIDPRASTCSLVRSIAEINSRSIGTTMSEDGRRRDDTLVHRHACLENEADCDS